MARPVGAVAITCATIVLGCGGSSEERRGAISDPDQPAEIGDPISSRSELSGTELKSQSPANVREYWTDERLNSAEPLPLPQPPAANLPDQPEAPRASGPEPSSEAPLTIPPSPPAESVSPTQDYEAGSETGFPNRTHGKLFFTKDGRDTYCSANVVGAEGRSLVFTAAHCVLTPGKQFATNLFFAPGYRNGAEPYGRWPAYAAYVPEEWKATYPNLPYKQHYSYDVAAVTFYPNTANQRVQDVVGGRGIRFNAPSATYQIRGYPATPQPYDGQRLIGCDTQFAGYERTYTASDQVATVISSPCAMSKGSSGGGWVTPDGYIVSVESHGYCEIDSSYCGYMYGPYFGAVARGLYDATRNAAPAMPVVKKPAFCARIKKKLQKAKQLKPRVVRKLRRKYKRFCR